MNIISFSLWGNNTKYTIGAINNVKIARDLFPEWTCRFYIGSDVPDYITKELRQLGAECVMQTSADSTGWNGMFWRFKAADSYDTVLSRDTDSRLSQREKAAVDEWLNSDKDFHIIRDHPYHATQILGGLWGVRNGLLKGVIGKAITNYDKKDFDNKYQVDQNFLKDIIYPLVKDKAMVHDEFFEKKPFPAKAEKRTRSYFVGQVYDYLDNPEFK